MYQVIQKISVPGADDICAVDYNVYHNWIAEPIRMSVSAFEHSNITM